MSDFTKELREIINARKKMTSPLYQVIMAGNASQTLLKNFVIHRLPIKNFWTRNVLGVASRIEDYALRVELIRNIYEEETGYLTNSKRHVESFADFGTAVGVTADEIRNAPMLPETKALIDHNCETCNTAVHFTAGVASVLLLMEGQPPIVSADRRSMLTVMRDVYGLPPEGYDFFRHHASGEAKDARVSELEDDHASAMEAILEMYCTTDELRNQAKQYLFRAINLRHAHFDAIYRNYHREDDKPFRYADMKRSAA